MGDIRDDRYALWVSEEAAAIARLARGYEYDTDRARDLEQDIHVALWRSFSGFREQCSPRTWIFRVAHNVATSHVAKAMRNPRLTTLDEDFQVAADGNLERDIDEAQTLQRVHALLHTMHPPDRQVMLLYLEAFSARDIAQICGLSSQNVAVKIHRIKQLIAQKFKPGGPK